MSPWARLDDNFHAHPRTLMAGFDANGLYARALSYCAGYLTDGFVPNEWVDGQGARKLAVKLVETGFFEAIEGGYLVIGYLDHNPSREEIESERNRERGKKRGQRGKSPRVSPGESPGDNHRDNPGEVVPMSPRKDVA